MQDMKIKKGLLFVISGPAGSGKGTVIADLLNKSNDFVYSVSATTRSPRVGEVHGKNYFFITREEFCNRIDADEMLEYTEYCTNYYGTPRKEVLDVLNLGKNVILEIEVKGAMQVKEKFPEAVLLMLLPPSFKIQESRLRGRATETEEAIANRLEAAKYEVKEAEKYNYLIFNADGEAANAADSILAIARAEGHRVCRLGDIEETYFQ